MFFVVCDYDSQGRNRMWTLIVVVVLTGNIISVTSFQMGFNTKAKCLETEKQELKLATSEKLVQTWCIEDKK